jgi:hypothetical protein
MKTFPNLVFLFLFLFTGCLFPKKKEKEIVYEKVKIESIAAVYNARTEGRCYVEVEGYLDEPPMMLTTFNDKASFTLRGTPCGGGTSIRVSLLCAGNRRNSVQFYFDSLKVITNDSSYVEFKRMFRFRGDIQYNSSPGEGNSEYLLAVSEIETAEDPYQVSLSYNEEGTEGNITVSGPGNNFTLIVKSYIDGEVRRIAVQQGENKFMREDLSDTYYRYELWEGETIVACGSMDWPMQTIY